MVNLTLEGAGHLSRRNKNHLRPRQRRCWGMWICTTRSRGGIAMTLKRRTRAQLACRCDAWVEIGRKGGRVCGAGAAAAASMACH